MGVKDHASKATERDEAERRRTNKLKTKKKRHTTNRTNANEQARDWTLSPIWWWLKIYGRLFAHRGMYVRTVHDFAGSGLTSTIAVPHWSARHALHQQRRIIIMIGAIWLLLTVRTRITRPSHHLAQSTSREEHSNSIAIVDESSFCFLVISVGLANGLAIQQLQVSLLS